MGFIFLSFIKLSLGKNSMDLFDITIILLCGDAIKEPSKNFLTWRLTKFVFKSYYPKSMFSTIGSREAKKNFQLNKPN